MSERTAHRTHKSLFEIVELYCATSQIRSILHPLEFKIKLPNRLIRSKTAKSFLDCLFFLIFLSHKIKHEKFSWEVKGDDSKFLATRNTHYKLFDFKGIAVIWCHWEKLIR